MTFRPLITLLPVLLAGCVHLPPGPERVSAGLERRTGHALLPRGASLGDGLTEEEAVSIALANNAAFLDTLADLGIARADVVLAGIVPNPTLTLLFPSGQKQLEFTLRLATEVLWLRPFKVKAATLDYEKTAEALVQNGLNLIRDVKLAFADVLAAEQRLRLAEEDQTRGRLRDRARIAARNGIMLVSHYRHLEHEEGMQFGVPLVLRGAEERLAPIPMTASCAGLALLPLVVRGNVPGHEIEYPMAVVILGGLVTSTALNLFLLPALYAAFAKKAQPTGSA